MSSKESLMPLPRRLKEARIRKGISQKKLGILAGIDEFSSSARVNQYEKGKHAPDFFMAKRFAEVLEVPTSYFYEEDDDVAAMLMLFFLLEKDEQTEVLGKLKSKEQ